MIMKLTTTFATVALAFAASSVHATTYTQDFTSTDLTAGISNYATFSNFNAGDVSSPFTPTSTELNTLGYRVYSGGFMSGLGSNYILATFSSAVSAIRVFPNIDHYG